MPWSMTVLLCFIAWIVSGCTHVSDSSKVVKSPIAKTTLSVAAAANLRDVLQDLESAYSSIYPDQQINLTFGSSALLVQQISQGAPFDLFLSADTLLPLKLVEANKTAGRPQIYAYGKVVMWSSSQQVERGLKLLLEPSVKKIAIANPELAPYGRQAVEALKKAGLYERIESKIVWAENINQAAQFAATGNADVGFIALSNAYHKEMKEGGKFYLLSSAESSAIAQSAVVLKGFHTALAREFLRFIRSEQGEEIWSRYGYQTPAH